MPDGLDRDVAPDESAGLEAAADPGPASVDPTEVTENAENAENAEAEETGPGPLMATLAERRDELLTPVATRLAKRLKRALQDDQNEVLERLRASAGTWSDDMVPSEAVHQSIFADAARALLVEAASAGVTFSKVARELAGSSEVGAKDDDPAPSGRKSRGRSRGPKPANRRSDPVRAEPDPAQIEAVSGALGMAIITALRQRLPSGTSPEAADAVGAAYREWRGERIESLAGDARTGAFSPGCWGTDPGAQVRWAAGPAHAVCRLRGQRLGRGLDARRTNSRPATGTAGPRRCRCLLAPKLLIARAT